MSASTVDHLYDPLTDHDLDPSLQALFLTIQDPPNLDDFILPLTSSALLPNDQAVSLVDVVDAAAVSSSILPIAPSTVSMERVNTVRTRPIEVIQLDRPLSDFQQELRWRRIPPSIRTPTGLFHPDHIEYTILWRNIMDSAKRRAISAALRLPMRRYHREHVDTVGEWLETAHQEIYDIALAIRTVNGPFWQPEFGRQAMLFCSNRFIILRRDNTPPHWGRLRARKH